MAVMNREGVERAREARLRALRVGRRTETVASFIFYGWATHTNAGG